MFNNELVVDLFAGGGGASAGIEMALGVSPDIAVNHNKQAIAMHESNHPKTKHFIEDVFEVDPVKVCGSNPVGLLWLSPDCRHFSKAKGSKPVSCDVRGLAWVGVRWAKDVQPRVIILENVEEFKTWGPLDDDNKPIKEREGETFLSFVKSLEDLGYKVEWNELRASDFGAPTIRKRLFLIARNDGKDIIWPEPTHGDPKKFPNRLPWKTAADCIDWSIPAHSIFLTKEEGKKVGVRRPLAENTMKRIARGLKKFVIDNPNPYIVKDKAPFITEHANGSSQGNFNINEPVGTVTAQTKGGTLGLVNAFIAQHNLGVVGRKADSPMSTITQTGSQQQLVTSIMASKGSDTNANYVKPYLMKYYGQGEGQDVNTPAHTITTKDRFAIVEVKGQEYEIVDVAMRMFTPRELYRAQGFPDTYKINVIYEGKVLPKTAQIRMCGNSVVPALAKVLVESNYAKIDMSIYA